MFRVWVESREALPLPFTKADLGSEVFRRSPLHHDVCHAWRPWGLTKMKSFAVDLGV